MGKCVYEDGEILTMRPVSARGRRVTVLPSTSRFVPIDPSTNSLGKMEVSIYLFIFINISFKYQMSNI